MNEQRPPFLNLGLLKVKSSNKKADGSRAAHAARTVRLLQTGFLPPFKDAFDETIRNNSPLFLFL
jgi:hypothetical protein